jgi:hypothetical protein
VNLLTLLRDSLQGINTRFHLVGINTLIFLVMPMTYPAIADEEWGAFVFMGLILLFGISVAIQGLAYHAAADPPGRPKPSGVRLGLLLFPTLLWLQVRLILICSIFPYLVVLTAQWVRTGVIPDENAEKQAMFWTGIFAQAALLLLSTSATPFAIRLREHGVRGRPIRDSLRFYSSRRRETGLILALILPAAALGAGVDILRGPAATDPVARIPEAFAIFVVSYLELVALFAASRVLTVALLVGAGDAGRPGVADPSQAGPAA